MDDILVLAPAHSRLRRAVRRLNQILTSLDLEKKTFIQRWVRWDRAGLGMDSLQLG